MEDQTSVTTKSADATASLGLSVQMAWSTADKSFWFGLWDIGVAILNAKSNCLAALMYELHML